MAFQPTNYTLQKKAAKDRAIEAARARAFADSQANKNIGRNFAQGLLSTGTGLLGEYVSGQMPWKTEQRDLQKRQTEAGIGLTEARTQGVSGTEARAEDKYDLAKRIAANQAKLDAGEKLGTTTHVPGTPPGQPRLPEGPLAIAAPEPVQQRLAKQGMLDDRVVTPGTPGKDVTSYSDAERMAMAAFKKSQFDKDVTKRKLAISAAHTPRVSDVSAAGRKTTTGLGYDPAATGEGTGSYSVEQTGVQEPKQRRVGSGTGSRRGKPGKTPLPSNPDVRGEHDVLQSPKFKPRADRLTAEIAEHEKNNNYMLMNASIRKLDALRTEALADFKKTRAGYVTGPKNEAALIKQRERLREQTNRANAVLKQKEAFAKDRSNFRDAKEQRAFEVRVIELRRRLAGTIRDTDMLGTHSETKSAAAAELLKEIEALSETPYSAAEPQANAGVTFESRTAGLSGAEKAAYKRFWDQGYRGEATVKAMKSWKPE